MYYGYGSRVKKCYLATSKRWVKKNDGTGFVRVITSMQKVN